MLKMTNLTHISTYIAFKTILEVIAQVLRKQWNTNIAVTFTTLFFKDYMLRNALYFIVIIYFAATIIMSGGSLLSWNNVIAISGQTSTKLFFSLGVAGLILITGTDLQSDE